jgi:uncharacterized membrane protein
MTDLIYVIATIAFFALMIVYVAACERLGRGATADEKASEEARS